MGRLSWLSPALACYSFRGDVVEVPQSPMSGPRRRAFENPRRALNNARGAYSITGIMLGLAAAGIAVGTDCLLESPVVYLVNIGALYVARYLFAVLYAAGINAYWKRHADQGHPDEHDLVNDHRYINAGTAVLVACLAVSTLVVTHDGTPDWMAQRWVVFVGTAVIGAATAESLLSFTPMWFYVMILGRLPQRNPTAGQTPVCQDTDGDTQQ